MKISVTVTGYIDVSDDWDDGQYSALDVADYRYNDQLTAEDALQELAKKMAVYPDDVEVRVRLPEVTEPLTIEQLREMDGEPAWWDDGDGSCWGIISVDSRGMWGGIPFFRGRWREVNFEYNIEERKMKIYRRPPEGEEDT